MCQIIDLAVFVFPASLKQGFSNGNLTNFLKINKTTLIKIVKYVYIYLILSSVPMKTWQNTLSFNMCLLKVDLRDEEKHPE